METRYEEVKNIIGYLQRGYIVGRKTVANERLAFLIVMVVITKRSIPQVVKIQRNQFFQGIKCFIFRGISPRMKNVYYIKLPLSFMYYLSSFCFKYHISEEGLIFPLNSDYVGNRIRELIKFADYNISINDIQTLIPYSYNTKQYQKFVFELLDILQDSVYLKMYQCFTGEDICNSICIFEKKYFNGQ